MSELSSVRKITNEAVEIHGRYTGTSKQITVPMTTLDQDLADYNEISLLKLDCQGYESEVLAGAHSVLQRTRILLTEILYSPYYEGAFDFADLYDLIVLKANFKLWGISTPRISQEGKPIWADAVFVLEG